MLHSKLILAIISRSISVAVFEYRDIVKFDN